MATDSIPMSEAVSSTGPTAAWKSIKNGVFHLALVGSACTADLEFSIDNGGNWSTFPPGGQGDTAGVDQSFTGPTIKKYDVCAGLQFRLNATGTPNFTYFVNGIGVQPA